MSAGTSFPAVWFLPAVTPLTRRLLAYFASGAYRRALVKMALRLKPDLIITDITMPHLSGIVAACQIKASLPEIRLLFVTMHSSSAYVSAAFQAGGTGYVLKSGAREELLEAVQSVLTGRMYISPSLSTEHLERFQNPAQPLDSASGRSRL